MQECVFDKMAEFIKVGIALALHFSIFPRRDYSLHALRSSLTYDGVAIISTIGQQVLGFYTFDKVLSLCAICSGTLRNKDSERHTMRIHGQM